MALVKFGAGVSEMRGKEGGVIYSRNAYGSYIKTKVSPVNPQTAKQLNQRSFMGNISQAWKACTAGQKGNWDALGAQVTRVNRFGDNTYYTGFNLFMKLNRNLQLIGTSIISVAPIPPVVPTLTLSTLTSDVSDNKITLAFSPTVPTDYTMFVYATPLIVGGRRFVKNYYRFIGRIAAAETSPQELLGMWQASLGGVLIAGAKIFVKCKFVNSVNGFEGVEQTLNATITA